MLGLLPCDLSLITIHILDWRPFSDIHISKSSVATYLGVVEYLNTTSLQIYYRVHQWKMIENRLIFGEVMGYGVLFFWLTVYLYRFEFWVAKMQPKRVAISLAIIKSIAINTAILAILTALVRSNLTKLQCYFRPFSSVNVGPIRIQLITVAKNI